jgi:outer membrane protein insertion porin family
MPRRFFLGIVAVALAFFARQTAQAAEIRRVYVRGSDHATVDEASVLAYVASKPGATFSREMVTQDVLALQRSGKYSFVDVKVEPVGDDVDVVFVVEPKMSIRRLEISGADYLGNKKVREIMGLGVGDLVNDAVLGVAAKKVREEYQKHFFPDAQVTWVITPLPEPGAAEVKIAVKEGQRASVRKIRFEGNRHIAARDLRKKMNQKTVNWLSWITGVGRYNPDDLQWDLETIRRAFLDQGYLDAKVYAPRVAAWRPKKLAIDIQVEEGAQYRIREVAVEGATLFEAPVLSAAAKIKAGDIASLAAIEKGAQAIRDYYGDRGYIRTDVRPVLDADPAEHTVRVVFRVREGTLAFIRKIEIRGNSVTKDKVIRREIIVNPGEVFSEPKVRTSERRLRNLGYFEYVTSQPESTAVPDSFDLVFDVEEKKTGMFMVGVGFSSVDALLGFVELQQGNFDLFGWPRFQGGGQKLKLRAQAGTRRTDYEISFVEPWFLDRRLSLGVDLFQHEARNLNSDYDQLNRGGAVSLGWPLSTYDRMTLRYGLEEIDIFNVSSNASSIIQDEKGVSTKSEVTLEVSHDTRDSFFVPTRGNRSSASVSVSGGPLLGDTQVYSLQARSSQYWPLWFDHVLNLRGWIGVVDAYGDEDRVPIFERFFLGGARTVRGFRYRDVGPRDERRTPIGGKSVFNASLEYTVPVAEKVRLAAFYDTGMVWTEAYEYNFNQLNSAAGVGIRFDFPGFPIQFDYAWPIETDEYNDRPSGRFSFWIGYAY